MGIAIDAGYAIVAAVTAPWWMQKARRDWPERFGRVCPLPIPQRPRVMIHAVSVGEVNLTRPLVDRLSNDYDLVVSVSTDTGIARARDIYGDSQVRVVRYPLDASWSVRHFLRAVDPDIVALVELELWPNFARQCARFGISLAVINGRLSERSFGRYRRGRFLIGRYFRQLAHAAVQDDAYARRFVEMGVPTDRCTVTGSMKWDSAQIAGTIEGAAQLGQAMGIDPARPLVVAGSTAPDEHQLLHDAVPDRVQLLCAPRRPEWFDPAADVLAGCVRRSDRPDGVVGSSSPTDRYVLDTIGELRKAYALADVVVIGRSFGNLYGSDPMEAAALGKPVVIGPAVADFASIVRTMQADGALIQTRRDELPPVLAQLLVNGDQRREMGDRARACVQANQGAADRHARIIRDIAAERTTAVSEARR